MKLICANCRGKNYRKLGNGEYRWKNCRKDFKPKPIVGMKITKRKLVKLVDLFLLGVNDPVMTKQLN